MQTREGFQSGFYSTCSKTVAEYPTTCVVYVISWKRVSENARNVFDAVKNVNPAYILNSDENFAMDRGDAVIQADDSYYFTKQMHTVFKHCAQHHPDAAIMTITGDVSPKANWKDVIDRCLLGFKTYNAGIVAPNVDYTDHTGRKTDLGDKYWTVQNTDCTVWSIRPCVYKFFLETDIIQYSKFGWGIDWLLIQVCDKYNLKVIRDYNNTISHPKDRGYGNEKATKEMQEIQSKWETDYKLRA
jgi:hypothetical protein